MKRLSSERKRGWRVGIAAYLKNGSPLETTFEIMNHFAATRTQLYDRSSDGVALDEVARILM